MGGKYRVFLVMLVLCLFSYLVAGDNAVDFYRSYKDFDLVYTSIQTSDGGYLLVNSKGNLYFDNLSIIKTDSEGTPIWNKTMNISSQFITIYARKVIETNEGFLIAGYASNGNEDSFILKTDLNGNLLWFKTYGYPTRDFLYDMVSIADGGFAAVGEIKSEWGNLNVDGIYSYIHLIKINSQGNLTANKVYGTTKWNSNMINGADIHPTSDGGFIIAGTAFDGLYSALLIKIDSNGNEEWRNKYSGGYYSYAKSVQETADGGYIILADAESPWRLLMIKTYSNGTKEWEMQIWDIASSHYFPHNIYTTENEGYLFSTGSTNIVETDSSGNILWNKSYGGIGTILSLQKTDDNGYIASGLGEFFLKIGGKSNLCNNGIMDPGELGVDCGGTCPYICYNDFYVSEESLLFRPDSNGKTKIRATVYDKSKILQTIDILLYILNKDGQIKETKGFSKQIEGNVTIEYSAYLNSGDKVMLLADPYQKIDKNQKDNSLEKEFYNAPLVYINVETSPEITRAVIKEHIKTALGVSGVTDDPSEADIHIYVGKHNQRMDHYKTSKDGWAYISEFDIIYAPKSQGTLEKPYAGLAGAFNDGKKYIYIYGNNIEGDVAAVKEFLKNEKDLINYEGSSSKLIVVNDRNIDAIGVFDFMHTPANKLNYNKNNQEFKKIVNKSLEGMYDHINYNVKTTNNESVILRLEQVKQLNSDKYLNYTLDNKNPVIFSGGIFSNLVSWYENNGLAKQMADSGREVWLMEMTGGPNTECITCPDYTYDDLVDYYWPASLAGITRYSGYAQFDYVGHSNGGRAALSSLNKYSNSGKNNAGKCYNNVSKQYDINCSLPAHVVDRFVGVAVPSVTNSYSPFTNSIRYKHILSTMSAGDYAMHMINMINAKHVRRFDYTSFVVAYHAMFFNPNQLLDILWINSFLDSGKISSNLMQSFNDLALNGSSNLDLSNFHVNKLRLFNTKPHDLIVPFEDQQEILDAATAVSDKGGYNYSNFLDTIFYNHGNIYTRPKVKDKIMEELK